MKVGPWSVVFSVLTATSEHIIVSGIIELGYKNILEVNGDL
jgi:hypothetical protein